jgi:hypothetical protein
MVYGKSNAQREEAVRVRKNWHLWFAWRPVRLDTGRMVWLEKVKRKGTICDTWEGQEWNYEYAVRNFV